MTHKIVSTNITFPAQIPSLSLDLKNLISKLLIKDPKFRLGYYKDAQDIKAHSWFKNTSFEDILAQKQPPPPKMDMCDSPNSSLKYQKVLKNFDKWIIGTDSRYE